MNKGSIYTILALAMTLATLTAVPGRLLAADHEMHGSTHEMHGSTHESLQTTEQKKQIYTTTGVLNSIDKRALKASITHDPMPVLGWPSMTMNFAFEDASLLEDLKAGDKVRFDFRNQGNTSVIVDIEIIK